MKYLKTILILPVFFCLTSCMMNQYEKQVVGKYELYKYDLEKPLKNVDDFSQLMLNGDKTFELKYGSKKISGNWSADDNGDFTLIEFEYQNKITEARVGREEILFNSLSKFGIENLNEIKFTKLE
jgi:hypothetical protein